MGVRTRCFSVGVGVRVRPGVRLGRDGGWVGAKVGGGLGKGLRWGWDWRNGVGTGEVGREGGSAGLGLGEAGGAHSQGKISIIRLHTTRHDCPCGAADRWTLKARGAYPQLSPAKDSMITSSLAKCVD